MGLIQVMRRLVMSTFSSIDMGSDLLIDGLDVARSLPVYLGTRESFGWAAYSGDAPETAWAR